MSLRSQFTKVSAAHHLEPYSSYETRKQHIEKIKSMLQQHGEALAVAVSEDFTYRPKQETLFLEIMPAINAANYCLKNLNRWMKKRKRDVAWQFLPASAYLFPQPLGVVGIMVPWNYPLYLSMVPLVYALAAGNRVLIKMSELSPQSGVLLKQLLQDTGIKESEVTVVNGGIELAKEFAALPFNHLLFTGSTETGKLILRAASDNLTPVTLELGGKSPVIISSSVNPDYFNRLFFGKLVNAGQSCIAPDYLLIPHELETTVEKSCAEFLAAHYPDLMNNGDYCNIISDQHKTRLIALLNDAKAKGARIVEFGEFQAHSQKLPFYLVFDATWAMQIMQEEIFGPLLPIVTYQTFADSIEIINTKPNPLALYYFGENKDEISQLRTNTLSGALMVNSTIVHIAIDDLPFGGVGASGMGHYHAREGFDTFSKLKPVVIKRRFSLIPWLYPPYGKLLRYFLSWSGGIKSKKK